MTHHQHNLLSLPPEARQIRIPWTFEHRSPVVIEQEVDKCPHCGEALRIRERISGMQWKLILYESVTAHRERAHPPKRKGRL